MKHLPLTYAGDTESVPTNDGEAVAKEAAAMEPGHCAIQWSWRELYGLG